MHVTVLGTAQDGGVPHLGCRCDRCERARSDPGLVRYPASLLVEAPRAATDDSASPRADAASNPLRLLVDASMDVRHQVTDVDAILLTHAHVGHLPGLLQFGREVADADSLPVYCTEGLADLIRENAPFSLLHEYGNVDLRVVDDGDVLPVGEDVRLVNGDEETTLERRVRVRRVPHRDELDTGTLAVSVEGHRTIRYLPDIDAWTTDLVSWVADADVALVDGTFWSDDELPRQADVPHPRVRESISRLPGDGSVRFTHLNHTNPVLDADSAERAAAEGAGFGVARRGRTFEW